MEKIKRDKNRFAISKPDETMVEAPEITGSYIFKKDKGTWVDVQFQTDRFWNRFEFVDPDEPNESQLIFLSEYLVEVEKPWQEETFPTRRTVTPNTLRFNPSSMRTFMSSCAATLMAFALVLSITKTVTARSTWVRSGTTTFR